MKNNGQSPDINELKKQMEGMMGNLMNSAMPEMKKVQDMLKAFTTPLKERNVKIMDVNCLVFLFEDKVSITLPTKELTIKFFDDIEAQSKENERLEKAIAENVTTISDHKAVIDKLVKEKLDLKRDQEYKVKRLGEMSSINYQLENLWFVRLGKWLKLIKIEPKKENG